MRLKFTPCAGENEFHMLTPWGERVDVGTKDSEVEVSDKTAELLLRTSSHVFSLISAPKEAKVRKVEAAKKFTKQQPK